MASSDVTILRAAEPSDAAGIAAIYNHYVEQSIVTFEEEPVSDAEMARRIDDDELRASFLQRVPANVWLAR